MKGTAWRLLRLIVAAALIPAGGLAAYGVASYLDGDSTRIDNNGSALGVLLIVASVFGVARVASPEKWSERSAVSLVLSASFFILTWVEYGDPYAGVDDSPHLIWYGVSVLVFTPAVVLMTASRWFWDSVQDRREIAPPST